MLRYLYTDIHTQRSNKHLEQGLHDPALPTTLSRQEIEEELGGDWEVVEWPIEDSKEEGKEGEEQRGNGVIFSSQFKLGLARVGEFSWDVQIGKKKTTV